MHFKIYHEHKGDQDLRIQLFSTALFNLWKSGSRTYWDPADRNEDIDPDVSYHSTNMNTKFHCIIFKNISFILFLYFSLLIPLPALMTMVSKLIHKLLSGLIHILTISTNL